MADIKLFELGPTRSARARWVLQEAGLPFQSIGNSVEVFKDDELKKVHPLGKLPAAIIDGKPLFESAAIVTAIADMAPDKNLIARPGTWSRNLHYQWVSFALTEMEAHLQSSEINTTDFILPKSEHVPAIVEQNNRAFRRAASVLNAELLKSRFLVDNRFSATDIVVGYTVSWGDEAKLLDDFPGLRTYLERLLERPHCTLKRH